MDEMRNREGKEEEYRKSKIRMMEYDKNKKMPNKVKVIPYRPGVAQRVSRGIALLFHDRGTRRG